MALTVLSSPGDTASVSNEMLFIINEATKANDDVTYPNYKYILDLYVDGTLVKRFRSNPDPVNRFGVFDVSKILQSYVPEYSLKANYSNQVEVYEIRQAYQVKLGEEYSDTQYLSLVTDTERFCFKTYKSRPYQSTSAISDISDGIASNMPNVTYGYKDEQWRMIPFYSNVSGTTFDYVLRDSSGAARETGVVVSSTAKTIYQVNMGFDKIVDELTLGQSDQDATEYIEFDVGDSTIHTLRYICSKYPIITLAWLNPYGAYESYGFGLVSKRSIETERKSFQQLDYRINASGVVSYSQDSVFYGRKKDYNTKVKTKLLIRSHLLSAEEYIWLGDMFISPQVFLYVSPSFEQGTIPVALPSGFLPVSISANNYDYRNYLNSKLTHLEFEVELSNDFNSQFL